MNDTQSRGATACGPCAKAKVRCTRTSSLVRPDRNSPQGWSTCDRCRRLKKACCPQQTEPRTTPVPRTRFGQLEKKVDALIESLAHQVQPSHEILETGFANILKSQPPKFAQTAEKFASASRNLYVKELATRPTQLPSPEEHATPGSDDPLWPSDDEAEYLLSVYSDVLGCVFPFVVPSKEPVAEFRRNRPYLFKAMVMAASYRSREMQKLRATDFTNSLSTAILLKGEKTLDMLQSLLVHISWYQCHLKRNTQMTNLTQLAIALLADLELNKPYHANDRRKLIFDSSRSGYGFSAETKTLTNEERRALLACYYFSSTGLTVYLRVDALKFTSHMQDALDWLVNANEYPTDTLLAYLVRSQKIVNEVAQIVPYDEPDHPRCRGEAFMMHLRTLDSSLTNFQRALPPSLEKHDFLLMHLHTARIFLYEVSLYDSPWQGTSSRDRLDALITCSHHLASFFDTFFLFPDEAFLVLPYSLWGQLSHALLVASRLCLLDFEGWGSQFVHKDVRLPDLLDKVILKLEQANSVAQRVWLGDKNDAILENVISKFKWVREWWQENGVPHARSTSGEVSVAEETDQMGMFVDGRFWEEIMADYKLAPTLGLP